MRTSEGGEGSVSSDTPGRGGEGGPKRASFCGRPLWMAPSLADAEFTIFANAEFTILAHVEFTILADTEFTSLALYAEFNILAEAELTILAHAEV